MRATRWLILFLALLVPLPAVAQVPPDAVMPGTGSDTITSNGDAVTLSNLPSGRGTASITVSNYCSCTLVVEGRGTANGDWEAIGEAPTLDADGVYFVSAAGLAGIRVRASAWASTTTTISIRVSSAGGGSGGGATGIAGTVDIEFNGTTPDLGAGTGGSATLRAILDSTQGDALTQTADATDRAADALDQIVSGGIEASVDDSPITEPTNTPTLYSAYAMGATRTAVTADADAVLGLATRYGVAKTILTGEDGSKSPIFAEDAAHTSADLGIPALCVRDDALSADAADGDYINCKVDSVGRIQTKAVIGGYLSGGAVPITMKSDSSDNDDETAVCTGPCTVYSITAFNHAATSAWLRCENDTAANTTPGSEAAGDGEPDFEIPGNTTGAGFTVAFPVGISYATALTCWIATGEASSNAVDAGLDDVTVLVSRVQ